MPNLFEIDYRFCPQWNVAVIVSAIKLLSSISYMKTSLKGIVIQCCYDVVNIVPVFDYHIQHNPCPKRLLENLLTYLIKQWQGGKTYLRFSLLVPPDIMNRFEQRLDSPVWMSLVLRKSIVSQTSSQQLWRNVLFSVEAIVVIQSSV